MTPALNHLVLRVMDFLLGWTLHLPSDPALGIVALGSALVLIGARVLTTNQDLLGRCESDRRRLKVLIQEAKRRNDKEALQRLRATKSLIALKRLRAEWKPPTLAHLKQVPPVTLYNRRTARN